jgi:NAD-dependent DNA ligase
LTQEEQMKLLKKYKFKVANYKVVDKLNYEFLTEYFEKRRNKSDYEIDGIVVFDNSRPYENVQGNPDYGFAFKVLLEEQKAEAIVEDVEWNVSKDGYIKPRIRIKPVKLVGTVITYATAFNAKYVVDNKLGPGAVITIVRSGDVIPDIVEVIKPSKEPKMPDIAYKWNKTKVDIIVKRK